MTFSSFILHALGFKKGEGKLGSTMKVITSPKSRRVSPTPLIFVHFPHGCLCSWRPFTPIEVFKPVLEACSGLQCFPFKHLPGYRRKLVISHEGNGVISAAFFIASKKKLLLQAFQSTSLTAKVGWGDTLESYPSVASWDCLYKVWAFCRVPFPSSVLCFLCIFSLYTLTPFSVFT